MDAPTRYHRSQSGPPTSANTWNIEPVERPATPARLETNPEFDPANYEIPVTIMAPARFSTMMPPKATQSAPTTPIYGTFTGPKEAPDIWFVPVTHKEKLAILTIEQIPAIVLEEAKVEAANDPTKYFSPTLYPFAERMKFTFARSMARARLEADNGQWSLQDALDAAEKNLTPTTTTAEAAESVANGVIYPDDVMTSLEVEAFFASIEEVYHPERPRCVVFRRYWRILASPGAREVKTGGVVSAGSTTAVHVKNDLQKIMKEKWAVTPKSLLAEYTVGANGVSVVGKMMQDDDE